MTATAGGRPLSLDAFAALVAEVVDHPVPEARYDDPLGSLGLDSLHYLELYWVLSELVPDVEVTQGPLHDDGTVRALYLHYLETSSSPPEVQR